MRTLEEKYQARLEATSSIGTVPLGHCINFDFLAPKFARELLAGGCADPEGRHNNSPTFLEIVEFCENNPSFIAGGYIITPPREDERITLNEVFIVDKEPAAYEVENFIKTFGDASNFDLEQYYVWYD